MNIQRAERGVRLSEGTAALFRYGRDNIPGACGDQKRSRTDLIQFGSAYRHLVPRGSLKLSCGLDGDLIRSPGMSPTGYQSPGYVASLREFGRPLSLSRTGGFLLERAIPGTDRKSVV